MSDQNDETQTYALLALAGVIALVLGGVLTLALWTNSKSHATAARPAATAGAPGLATTAGASSFAAPAGASGFAAPAGALLAARSPAADATRRIYFASGSDALPEGASQQLAEFADALRGQAGRAVLISGYHDASGDPEKNAELAKNRAKAVRHALEANGLAAEQLVMDKPVLATGGGDPREARRVEVRPR